jgi:hypothetical protein
MNSIEKLHAYQNAYRTINAVEAELRKMVNAFFKDCPGGWYLQSLDFGNEFCTAISVPKIVNLCVEEVIMGEGEYYTFPVPSSIIMKYLDGNKEEAAKEFQQWHKEYWEQKKREQEEAKRREDEALAKKSEEDEYKLYLKLKDKFENERL